MAGYRGEKAGNSVERPHELEREKGEEWRLKDVISELHVAHSGHDARLGFWDQGATLSIEQQIKWVYRDFYDEAILTLGTHTLGFPELTGNDNYKRMVAENDHRGFLLAQKRELERAKVAMALEFEREKYPTILFSVEADLGFDQEGNFKIYPPAEVLQDQEIGLDFVTASFHYDRIPREYQDGEHFYQGFKAAIESGLVQRFGHPFWELHLVREWDKVKYQEILDLARQAEISFEISTSRAYQLAENEPTSEVLKELIENGDLISFGTDFHNFIGWMKRSSVAPKGVHEGATPIEQGLMERWQWPIEFRRKEERFWNKTVKRVFELDVSREMGRGEANDYLWRLYKADESLPDFVGVDEDEKEAVFSQLRNKFVEAVLPSEQGQEVEELRQRLSAEMTELFVMYRDRPERALAALAKEERQSLEQGFAEIGMNLGDLKRALYCVHILRVQYNLPRSQFVNVWPIEAQLKHLRKQLNDF